jgi:hypothetical protein
LEEARVRDAGMEELRTCSLNIDAAADIESFIDKYKGRKVTSIQKRMPPISIEAYELPVISALYPLEAEEKVKLDKMIQKEADQRQSWRAEMNALLDKAWVGVALSGSTYLTFNLMIKERVGRRIWVKCMNQRRADGCYVLEDPGFQMVGELMLALLNEVSARQCERSKDFTTAKHCIILSQTFHCEATDSHDKLYLQNVIEHHSLWREIQFWEKVIHDGIDAEVKQHQHFGLGKDDVGEEADARLKLIVFGQVSSYIHVMMTFSLQTGFIEDLVRSYADKFDLDKHDLRTLMTPFMPATPEAGMAPNWLDIEGRTQLAFSYSADDSPNDKSS